MPAATMLLSPLWGRASSLPFRAIAVANTTAGTYALEVRKARVDKAARGFHHPARSPVAVGAAIWRCSTKPSSI